MQGCIYRFPDDRLLSSPNDTERPPQDHRSETEIGLDVNGADINRSSAAHRQEGWRESLREDLRRSFAAACQREETKRVAGTRHRRGGHPKESGRAREWSGELTPVTRGGCNHVSAVPCFLDWTVGPVSSRWSPLSSPSTVSLTRVQTRIHTRKPRPVGPSVPPLFPRSLCPPSLFVSPFLSLCLFLSFVLALSRWKPPRTNEVVASACAVGTRDEFPFSSPGLSPHPTFARDLFLLSFSTALRQLHFAADRISDPSFLLRVLCTIKFSLFGTCTQRRENRDSLTRITSTRYYTA